MDEFLSHEDGGAGHERGEEDFAKRHVRDAEMLQTFRQPKKKANPWNTQSEHGKEQREEGCV